jgi:hypothetical protein
LWLVVGGWFVLREKYCWLLADKPSERAVIGDNLCQWEKVQTKEHLKSHNHFLAQAS